MQTITITNHKGGVGKTTLAFNLAGCLAKDGKKVLVIDLDPQGNLTNSFGLAGVKSAGGSLGVNSPNHFVKNIFLDDVENSVPAKTNIEGISLLASDGRLSSIQYEMVFNLDIQYKLREYLKELTGYDVVLIDTPPTLGSFLTIGAIASEWYLLAISSSYYSMQGTSTLLSMMGKVKNLNPDLAFMGAVVSIHDMKDEHGWRNKVRAW